MTVRERIRRIRLMEKIQKNSEYAKNIGVTTKLLNKKKCAEKETELW